MARIKTSKKAEDQISVKGLSKSDLLVNHLRDVITQMVSHRQSRGVDKNLRYCQSIIDDNLQREDTNALEYEKEIDQAIDGVTATKRDDAISVHSDLIIGQLDKLFKISPTPVPDLPKREEEIVIEKIEEVIEQQIFDRFEEAELGYMEQLTLEGIQVTREEARQAIASSGLNFVPTEDEIYQMAKEFKSSALSYIHKRATTGAKKMEREIHDIVVETNFGDELLEFIHDFNTYPYAVMRIGAHLPFSRKVWRGNKWCMEDQALPIARRIAPQNFYWSADSLEINDGSAVGDVLYVRRSDLERMYHFEEDETIKKTIAECVKECNSFKDSRNWMDSLGHNEEKCSDDEGQVPWNVGTTVPCFRLHTLLDSCFLKEKLKVKPDTELSQLEVEAWVINKKIVRFKVYDPKGYERPYAIEKFRRLPGRFEGKSLPEILRPIEHQVRSVKRNKLLNIGFSSAPVTLRDETAFNVDEGELPDVISPGDNLTVRGYAGRNIKPVEYVLAPNITAQLRAEQSDLYTEADIKSQIPSLLTGNGNNLGSGVRSASMLATQISSASKNLKRQIWLIAANVIKPYIEEVFDYYMREGSNDGAKIDAAVNIGSIESLVNREFLVQHIQNLIQYLAPYVQSGQVPQSVIQQLLFTLMSETGISDDSNDAEILEEFQGIANDVGSNIGLQNQTGPQLDGRSNFQVIDTGKLGQ